jgi:hypothetical protein
MPKKYSWYVIPIFILTLLGIAIGYTLGEKKNEARFYLGCEGGNAQIFLGEKNLGPAPIKNYLLPSGWYELTIVTDYYRYSTPIQLSPQTATIVDWKISHTIDKSSGVIYELLPQKYRHPSLKITSVPDRAVINFAGDDTSVFSPFQTDTLPPGNHSLTISLPGYHEQQLPFTLTNGYLLQLTVKLAPSD